MSKVLEKFVNTEYRGRELPDFRVGDIVRVHQMVPDIKAQKKLSKTAKAIQKSQGEADDKAYRIQIFEGVVITRKHGGEPGASFTVRKIASHNVGVEKIYPLYSPLIKKIEVVSRPVKVRRAKLYFLRDRVGKKAKRLGVGVAVEQKITSVGELEKDLPAQAGETAETGEAEVQAPENKEVETETPKVETKEETPKTETKEEVKAETKEEIKEEAKK